MRKIELPQSRRHVWMFDEDWEYLRSKYGGDVGPSQATRMIVHRWIQQLKEKEQAAIDRGVRAANSHQASEKS